MSEMPAGMHDGSLKPGDSLVSVIKAPVQDKHVLVAVCSYDSRIDVEVSSAINHDCLVLGAHGWQVSMMYEIGNMDVPRARNNIFSIAYHGPFSDLIFIDSDISWERGSPGMKALLERTGVELVAYTYPKKSDTKGWAILPIDMGKAPVMPAAGELLEVAAAPTGFMRITRACMDKMVKAYDDRWYKEGNPPGKSWSLFEFGIFERTRVTEDYQFCILWKSIGGRIWVDPDQVLEHHGTKTYADNLRGYMQKIESGLLPEPQWSRLPRPWRQ